MNGILKKKDVAKELGCSSSQVHILWTTGRLRYNIEPKLPGRSSRHRYSTPKDIRDYLKMYR